jgi:hypothetical protein
LVGGAGAPEENEDNKGDCKPRLQSSFPSPAQLAGRAGRKPSEFPAVKI